MHKKAAPQSPVTRLPARHLRLVVGGQADRPALEPTGAPMTALAPADLRRVTGCPVSDRAN